MPNAIGAVTSNVPFPPGVFALKKTLQLQTLQL